MESNSTEQSIEFPNNTVWIVNYAGHEYLPAIRYGKFKYVTKGYVSFQSLDRVKFQIAEALIDSKPDDYLLLSGTTTICVIAAIVWYQMHKKIKILNWDKKANNNQGDYKEMIITHENLTQLLGVLHDGDQDNGSGT